MIEKISKENKVKKKIKKNQTIVKKKFNEVKQKGVEIFW